MKKKTSVDYIVSPLPNGVGGLIFVPLKAIEFNGVDTTVFLKNFVVLMYFFMFVDLLESNC